MLTCVIAKPNVEAVWFKDVIEITPGGRYEMSRDDNMHTLAFSDVTLSDAGDYTVKVGETSSTTKLCVTGIQNAKFYL